MENCKVPPEGWYCTRECGHGGPCAAYPDGFDDTNLEDYFLTGLGTFDTKDCISHEDLRPLFNKADNWEQWMLSQIEQEGVDKYKAWYARMNSRCDLNTDLIEAHNKLFKGEMN